MQGKGQAHSKQSKQHMSKQTPARACDVQGGGRSSAARAGRCTHTKEMNQVSAFNEPANLHITINVAKWLNGKKIGSSESSLSTLHR